ncbi:hypothetical protein EYF80_003633 [Liparis tanakae]|uniref:Uncharacterized protein n=1 Tax=Liparis tanakae TaxID=230148 RepID=A0A4Z2J7P9_9TELE|nr:hypothetical protein EYF80_003633 [Liparis tanakae]
MPDHKEMTAQCKTCRSSKRSSIREQQNILSITSLSVGFQTISWTADVSRLRILAPQDFTASKPAGSTLVMNSVVTDRRVSVIRIPLPSGIRSLTLIRDPI